MVHYFESRYHEFTLELERANPKKDIRTKNVKFVGKEFTTDDDKLAKMIEGSDAFKNGKIWKRENPLPKTGTSVRSGAVGTA